MDGILLQENQVFLDVLMPLVDGQIHAIINPLPIKIIGQ